MCSWFETNEKKSAAFRILRLLPTAREGNVSEASVCSREGGGCRPPLWRETPGKTMGQDKK